MSALVVNLNIFVVVAFSAPTHLQAQASLLLDLAMAQAGIETRSATARSKGNYEALRNIDNRTTARHASWIVKVLSPKVVSCGIK